jgi:hypothetical protein
MSYDPLYYHFCCQSGITLYNLEFISFLWNLQSEDKKYDTDNIVQNLYYGKCTGKRHFTLQNFSLPKKNQEFKKNFFTIGPTIFIQPVCSFN